MIMLLYNYWMALFSASGGNFILLVSQWWWWECSTVEHRAISLSDPNYRGQLWDTERGRHAWTCVQHLDNLTHTHTHLKLGLSQPLLSVTLSLRMINGLFKPFELLNGCGFPHQRIQWAVECSITGKYCFISLSLPSCDWQAALKHCKFSAIWL